MTVIPLFLAIAADLVRNAPLFHSQLSYRMGKLHLTNELSNHSIINWNSLTQQSDIFNFGWDGDNLVDLPILKPYFSFILKTYASKSEKTNKDFSKSSGKITIQKFIVNLWQLNLSQPHFSYIDFLISPSSILVNGSTHKAIIFCVRHLRMGKQKMKLTGWNRQFLITKQK